MRLLLAAILILGFRLACAQDLLLEHAHIVDPESQTVTDGNLLIHSGVIRSIGLESPVGFKGKRVDLTGRWVLPGFVDSHVHSEWGDVLPYGVRTPSSTIENARKMLYSGITAFIDLFAHEDKIFRERDRQRKGLWLGPDVYAAGPMLTCTEGHGTHFGIPTRVIDSPDQAEAQIRDLVAKRHPDVLKIAYDHAWGGASLNESTMKAIVQAAKKFQVKTIVHIGTWDDARQAVLAGADVITHLYHTEIPDDLVKLMHDRGVSEIPTMAYQTEIVHLLQDASWLDAPLLRAVADPELLAAYRGPQLSAPFFLTQLAWQRSGESAFPRSLKKLSDGGVTLMTGTDASEIAVFQGFSLHREMKLFVDAGLSSWQTLAAATTNANAFLGLPSGIHVGSRANLVVLSRSPLTDITNTQSVEMVILHGRIVDRTALLTHESIAKKPTGKNRKAASTSRKR